MIRVYITPFDDAGDFGAELEITPYVDLGSIGKIKRSLDNSTYDIGVFRYNNLSLKLHNAHGMFSDVENLRSIFRVKRSGSKVRIAWSPDFAPICGVAVCGECVLSEEIDLYEGVLNDDASYMNVDDQIIQFQVLSFESQLSKVIVPFADLEDTDTMKDIVYKTLNQYEVTRYLEVEEVNMSLMVNYIPDDLTWFENRTGKETLESLLLASNSVLFCDGKVIKALGRTPSLEVKKSFYGQASVVGNENIVDIENYRIGNNRIVNIVRWKEGGGAALNAEAFQRWGAFSKEIDLEFVTDISKQNATANSIVDEFKEPKREFELSAILDPEVIVLKILDRVNVDNPTVSTSAGKYSPIVGLTKIGDVEAPLPHIMWDLQITQDDDFKIMGIEIDLKKEIATFSLREI